MSHSRYSELEDHYSRLNTTPLLPLVHTIAYTLAGLVLGALVLEQLGYPPRYLVSRLARMASEVFGLQGLFDPPSDSESSDEMQRSGGMFGSLFNLPTAGSILSKGVRGVAGALSLSSGDKPPGLGNRNNACYQNSVMQGLASLPSLRDYLSKMTSEHASLNSESINGALLDMISKLNNPDNKGQHFWIQGKLKNMSTWEQQDAQEYYSKILDALDEEIKKASSSKRRSSVSFAEATKSLVNPSDAENDSVSAQREADKATASQIEQLHIPPNPLDGLLAQRVGCTACGYSEGLTLIPSNCITVSLGRNYGYDISECLDEYTSLEFIDGVECAKCTLLKMKNTVTALAAQNPTLYASKLKAVQDALDDEDFEDKTLIKTLNVAKKNWIQSTKSKQAVVARAPKALVLHVNRSSFNEYTGEPVKNTAGVAYPSTLDLGKWCLGNNPSGSRHPDMSLEQWPRDPNKSMLSDNEPMTNSPFQYRLRAAVLHSGSHGYGHYVCYRPHPRIHKEEAGDDSEDEENDQGEQWWRFSDDSVYAVSEDDAHQGNVFMLFYERIDEPAAPCPRDGQASSIAMPVAEDAPLPPADITSTKHDAIYDMARASPLPEEDDLLEVDSPKSVVLPGQPAIFSEPTSAVVSPIQRADVPVPSVPKPSTDEDIEMSEAESDAPSTQVMSDNESEADIPSPPTPKIMPVPPVSPHMMRTAGNAAARGQGKRQSLPLVSAT
ncbi:ubiquitin-specific protease ubp1 [Coniothyrium glycines]